MQYNGNHNFYLHDRLGSVRQIVDKDGLVVKYYTFGPFGDTRESGGSLNDPFMFTGHWFDPEIGQYYLRARQYDPILMRFTTRDPVFGQFEEPMTLCKYLYCDNEPINIIDPVGLYILLMSSYSINSRKTNHLRLAFCVSCFRDLGLRLASGLSGRVGFVSRTFRH